MTVLFAQAAGLGELPEAERITATDVLFSRLRAVIERHGGAIDKFIGDTVMAVFGAPVAHEDDPVRGCRAALEIARGDPPLRVGLNTGEVLYGSVGGDRATVMGDPVNVAQRLMAAADPGAVLVSKTVERLAPRAARFRALEPLHVKGRREPVEAFEALDLLPGRTEIRLVPDLSAPLVGRDAEIARLRELVARAPAFAIVEGAPGVGKSRLLAELRRSLRKTGPDWQVLVGRALDGFRLPMFAFGEMLRTEFGVSGFDMRDADVLVKRIVADLEGAAPTDCENWAHLMVTGLGYSVAGARVTGIEPAQRQAETHHAWERWLKARASRRPLLVCVEDLHWADPGTLGLLEVLPARLKSSRVAILATARPGAALPKNFEAVALGDLDATAALALAESALGAPMSDELRLTVVERTGGNPYYVEELSRFLLENHLVQGSPLRLAQDASRIPEGLQGLLVSRLDALPDGHKEALKGASVVGRTFWEDFLGSLLQREVRNALSEARRREMVFPQDSSLLPGDRQQVFKHALLRDAAYSLVTKKERSRLHAATAALLESRVADGGRRVKALAARHHDEAGNAKAAARLWMEAASEAQRDGSWEESLPQCREAARLGGGFAARSATAQALLGLGRTDEALAEADRFDAQGDEIPRAFIVRSRILSRRGDLRGSLSAAQQAVATAPPGHWRVSALLELFDDWHRLGEIATAEGCLQEAQSEFQRIPPDPSSVILRRLKGDIAMDSGWVRRRGGAFEAGLQSYRQAEEVFESLGLRSRAASAMECASYCLLRLGRAEEGLVVARRACAYHRASGNRSGMAAALLNIGTIAFERGHLADAIANFRESLELQKETGYLEGAAICLNNIGAVLERMGQMEESLEALQEALALRRKFGTGAGAASTLGNIASIHAELGAFEDAAREYAEAMALMEAIDDRHGLVLSFVNLGRHRSRQGEFGEALRLCLEGLARATSHGDRAGAAHSRAGIAEAQLALGEVAAARASLAELDRELAGVEAPAASLAGLLILADLESREGNAAAAAARAAEAAVLARRITQRADVAEALILQAAATGASEARPVAEEALALAGEFSHPRLRALALALLARLDAEAGRIETALEGIRVAGSHLDPARFPFRDRLFLLEQEARIRAAAGDLPGGLRAAREACDLIEMKGSVGLRGPFTRMLRDWTAT
mgnify:CR=1 FL=1